jgi:hypothetical protein
LVRVISWIVDAVITVIEKRTNTPRPVDRAPPVQPYPRQQANGHWDEDRTDPQIRRRR